MFVQVKWYDGRMGNSILAPWSAEQVASLNGYQSSNAGHPFTCGNPPCRSGGENPESRYANLRATADGWRCDWCGYMQDWAWGFMADLSWQQPGPWPLAVFAGTHGQHHHP